MCYAVSYKEEYAIVPGARRVQGSARGRIGHFRECQGDAHGNMCFKRYLRFEMRQACNPDDNNADEAGVNPDKQQLLRQLKAGESVLTRVRQEKNKLQDANTQLGEELKDVRIQLSSAVKENRRLRRGIFSKCLNESSKKEFGEEVD